MRIQSLILAVVCALPVFCAQQKTAQPASEMEKAVEEFKVQTRNLGLREDSPRRARSSAGNLVWHGRLYENLRNDFLDAVPHQITQRGGNKSLLRRNQFGFNVSGPVVIPRLYSGGRTTFFSLSYEGMRERISRTYLRTIPTLAERGGDWSETVNQAGQLLPIYDPSTTRENPDFNPAQPVSTDNLQYIRDPFPGNLIPTARQDPVVQKAVSFYPSPNAAVGPFFRNNYFINTPEANSADGVIAKLDHAVGERHRITSEIAFSNGFLGAARWFPNAANPGDNDRRYNSRRGSVDYVFTASSNTVNTVTFAASSDSSRYGLESGGGTGDLGIANAGGESFPVLSFQPYLAMGRSNPSSRYGSASFVWVEALSLRRGKHSLRFVAEHINYRVNSYGPQYPSGYFRFGSGLTSLPGIVDTGHAFASFLLGQAEYAEKSVVVAPSYFRRAYSLFVLRDQWEVRKGLTFSVGGTLTRRTPRIEKYDRQSTIDLSVINPANGRPGALVAAARDGRGRAFQSTRVSMDTSASLAWNPRGSTKTVVRASWSRSYAMIPMYSGQWGTQGFNDYPTYISSNVQLQPAVVLSRGLPPLTKALPDLRPEAANDTTADLVDTSGNVPVYQSASLHIERELPGSMMLSFGADTSGGRDLFLSNGGVNPNAVHLDYLVYRDELNDEKFNRALRPYPQFKGFDVYSAWPAGNYHRSEAWVRLEKRASRGITFSTQYEFSKQMDDYSGPYGKQDFFHNQNEWSVTTGSVPHRLRLSYTYELPLGTGKGWLRFPDWRRFIVDGWSFTGTGITQTGGPIFPRPQYNNTGGVVQALRVNVVPGVSPRVKNPGPELWFNPAAFDQPADFTIGNGPRTLSSVLAPGYLNYDMTVNKRVSLGADLTLEFSVAGFNSLNHANWNDPDMVIGPADAPNVNAGKIIGSVGGRVIQLGLRISF